MFKLSLRNISFKTNFHFHTSIRFAFFLFPLTFVHAQTWSPLGNGFNNSVMTLLSTQNGDSVYAGGRFTRTGLQDMRFISLWTNNQWNALGPGLDNPVRTITKIDGKIFVGGEFAYANDSQLNCFAEWDGTEFKGYQRGFFKSGQHSVAATVNAIVSYKNQIYAAGIFDYGNDKQDFMKNIARWNGTKWEAVSGGLTGNSGVNCMVVFNDTLYVGGGFSLAGDTSVNNIARWDGSTWKKVGNGMNDEVTTLTICNNQLYAGGVFDTSGGYSAAFLAKWDGANWLSVDQGLKGSVYTLACDQDALVVGGSFITDTINKYSNLAKWTGTKWISGQNPSAMVRCIYAANSIYVGGDFTSINQNTFTRIAKTETFTKTAEIPESSMMVYPNPVSDALNILAEESLKIKEIYLMDMFGRIVLSQKLTHSIIVTSIPSGNYILLGKSETGFFKKIVTINHTIN